MTKEKIEGVWEAFKGQSDDYLTALLVIAAGILIIKMTTKIAKKALEKSSLDASVYSFILTIIKYSLYVVIAVIVLSVLNVPTAPLVTVIGAMGAAIALALKDSLSNVASGILILLRHPFKQGDFVSAGGFDGIVDSIDIISTTLKTVDNRRVIIPNSQVMGNAIVNSTHETVRRIDLSFGISYKSDIEAAKEAVLSAATSNSSVLSEPEPFAGVGTLGESAVNIDLRCWVETSRYLATKYEITEAVRKAFGDKGIEIPYAQLDVHIDNKNS